MKAYLLSMATWPNSGKIWLVKQKSKLLVVYLLCSGIARSFEYDILYTNICGGRLMSLCHNTAMMQLCGSVQFT